MKLRLPALIQAFILIVPMSFQGQQIENPGFENWEPITGTLFEPVDWNTIKTADNDTITWVAPVTYEKSTDAHSGDFALKLFNVKTAGIIATGAICNGRFHAEFDLSKSFSYSDTTDARWHTPFTYRPDSLAGWFKYFPQEDDRAQFKVILHVGECKLPENGTLPNWVGMAVYNTTAGITYGEWTRFVVPFDYYSEIQPSYLLCVLNSGDSTDAVENSYLIVDDLKLIYSSSGIPERKQDPGFLKVYKDRLLVTIHENEFKGQLFYLTDMTGKPVLTQRIDQQMIMLPAGIRPGVYVALLNGKSSLYTQKIIIQ